MFERADFERMAAQLSGIKGRFIMSINDVPEIREAFKSFNIDEVQTRYSIAGGGKSRSKIIELIISNGP